MVDVGDDDGLGTGCARTQQRDEADWAGATDERRVAELQLRAVDGGECDGERLEERAVFEGHGWWQLVTPFRGVVDIAPEETGNGGSRQEEDMFATVVAARKAGLAGMAGNVGFDGDAVTGLEMLDGRVHGEDLRELVVGFAGR